MSRHREPPWELWRQDDNGNRFLVSRFSRPEQAEACLQRLKRSPHKQWYWIRRREPAPPPTGAEGTP